jgi:Second BRCT domain on Nijmegen syndrome breakage protein/FHA domain
LFAELPEFGLDKTDSDFGLQELRIAYSVHSLTVEMSLPTSCGFLSLLENFSKVLCAAPKTIGLVANETPAGKRLWLRPGQRYLFGRVKKDGVFQAIDHKGVSRRQCVIEVEKVNPGDGSLLHTRSKLTVTDEKSKSGTYIDGKLLKGASQELKRLEHHIKLGAYPHVLIIKWQPVCLSFFLTSKERKNADPLAAKRDLLEPLDIKTVQPFVSNQTSHVVASKRNTVPGLQALISGKYIVDHSYTDALVFAATPDDLEGDENLSPLEKDFDAAWPDPVQHLPPKGREPTEQLSESYSPNTARKTVFESWTFVFLEPGQYETILPAITTGHGKALLYNLEPGRTTPEDVVTYMRNAAGEKGFGSLEQSTDAGGVILIKPTLKGELLHWGDKLASEVALKLDQKYIDQADFLDAILRNDAASLRKAIPFESMSERVPRPPTPGKFLDLAFSQCLIKPPASAATVQVPASGIVQETQIVSHSNDNQDNQNIGNVETLLPTQNATPEQEAPLRKRPRTRATPVSRFKAFDDEFDMDAIAPYEPPEESIESQTHLSQATAPTPFSDEDEASQINGQGVNARKRARSPADDAMVDGLLPAAAAMKKRKLEMDRENKRSGVGELQKPIEKHAKAKARKAQAKEINVRAVARKQREAEEEATRRDQEVLEARLGDMSAEDMKHLAVVVEMEMPIRNERAGRANRNASDRWDERWNGRKNFKKFRRKGEGDGSARRPTQNVIVPLVEVKKKNYGIGEAYWSSSRDKEKDAQGQSGQRGKLSSQTQTEESTLPTMTRLQQEAGEIVEAIEVDHPRQTRLGDKTQQSQQTMNSSRGKKRGASSAANGSGSGVAKKQRTIRTRAASESESDGELRFKFGGRRK